MSFILAKTRDIDPKAAFYEYKKYLHKVKDIFPPSAYELATSEWYFDPNDHKCPHDAWLEEINIFEPSQGERNEVRKVSIKIKLFGAYQNGFIEFYYSQVFSYRLTSLQIDTGHHDWRYDEFRLSENGRLLHEIEWSSLAGKDCWLIEADDVHFKWTNK